MSKTFLLIALTATNLALAACCLALVLRAKRRGSAPAAKSGGGPAAAPPPAPEETLDDVAAAVKGGSDELHAAAADLRTVHAAGGMSGDGSRPGGMVERVAALLRSGRTFEQRLGDGRVRLEAAAGRTKDRATDLRVMAEEVGRHRARVGAFCDRVERETSGPAADVDLLLAATADLAAHNGRLLQELEQTRARLAEQEVRLCEAERLARTDALTGLANRRVFTERLAESRARLERGHEDYSVVLFDIDRFKAVNDTYGHAAGDAVIVAFARLLAEAVRPYDLPARFGGEEFAVLLPGAKLPATLAVAERVRSLAERAKVPHDGRELRFTVSGGAAEARPGVDAAELLAAADAALYAAKAAGRNRVEAAEPPDDEEPTTVIAGRIAV